MFKKLSVSEILRISSAVLIGILLIACFVLWVLNYQTMESLTKVSHQTFKMQYHNMKHYQKQYQTTRLKLEETESVLAYTVTELAMVRDLNDQLLDDIQELEEYKFFAKGKEKAIESMAYNFRKKNKSLKDQMKRLQEELDVFQADIADMSEGHAKIKLFKKQIKAVKKNMVVLKKEAHDLKVAVQKEKDRLASLYGNGGYIVKDTQNRSISTFDPNQVRIEVKMLNK